MQPDTHNHYGSVSRFLHWGMALCFALMFLMALAWRLDARWQSLIPAHEALGNLLLMLLFFRFIWAIASENRPAADSHADRLATIRDVHEKYGRLIDPHTADGVHVARQWQAAHPSDRPMICLETALPAKFEETVFEATGLTAPRPERFRDIEHAPRRVEILANDVQALKDYIASHLAQH